MSRIGKQPIEIKEGVTVDVADSKVLVKGPRGELDFKLPKVVKAEVADNKVNLTRSTNQKLHKALHGTYRALVNNAVIGVSEGWSKTLELVGTGYRASIKDNDLTITVGYSHPIEFKAPEGITFSVEKLLITISGVDKELVGLTAANIRKVRPPEPYKGKGIRYQGEVVRRKPGKAAKAAS